MRCISATLPVLCEASTSRIISTGSATGSSTTGGGSSPTGGYEGGLLDGGQVGAALGRQAEQVVEKCAVERLALGGPLHLDEPPVAGHHDVHVGVRADVLLVGQVEARGPVDDPHRDRRDGPGQRATAQRALLAQV